MVGIRADSSRSGGVKWDSDKLLGVVVRRRVSEIWLNLGISVGGSTGVEENEIPRWLLLSIGVANVAWIHEDQGLQTVALYLCIAMEISRHWPLNLN